MSCHGRAQQGTGLRCTVLVSSTGTAHLYSLSRYSPGTSSSGTSCVRTSCSSVLSARSTPATTSASNAFPPWTNSSTLSESAASRRDNPCKSPDCSPERDPRRSGKNANSPTLLFFFRGCFLAATLFFSAPFGAAFFFVNFLERFFAFVGVTFLWAVLFAFFVVFFLGAIRAV